jgi:hypothetical protein
MQVDSTSGPRVVYKLLNFQDLFSATPMESFWDMGLLDAGGKLDEERYGKHGWQVGPDPYILNRGPYTRMRRGTGSTGGR